MRLSALEEQQKRLDIRLNQLSHGVPETQTEFQRLRWQQQEACKREEELQEHLAQRLQPLDAWQEFIVFIQVPAVGGKAHL